MKQRVWVIAGNEHQYHDYVRNKPLNGDKKYCYVYKPETLRGFINPHGVFIGTWRHRADIIPIIDMLIMSTHEDTKNLHKIRLELMMNASHTQMNSAAISSAADMLAKAIDQEVLDQMMVGKKPTVFDIMEEYDQMSLAAPTTWKGFVK